MARPILKVQYNYLGVWIGIATVKNLVQYLELIYSAIWNLIWPKVPLQVWTKEVRYAKYPYAEKTAEKIKQWSQLDNSF